MCYLAIVDVDLENAHRKASIAQQKFVPGLSALAQYYAVMQTAAVGQRA